MGAKGQPTIDDVAAAAGVSSATVSRALRNHEKVAPATRERVRAAAERLHYIASPTASGLALGRSRLVGVITPYLGWFFSTVVASLDKTLHAHDHHLLLIDLEDSAPDERLALRQSRMFKRVDGLVLVSVELRAQEAALVRRLELPVVTVGDRFGDAPSVGVDDVQCTRLAAEHLLELGHERVAYVGVARSRSAHRRTPADRLAGFRRVMHEHDRLLREDWVLPCDWSARDAYAVALRLLRGPDRPSAVLAASDEMAVGVLGAAAELGLRVPQELSVVGVDDHDIAGPLGLTTVRQNVPRQGAAAAAILLALLDVTSGPTADQTLPVSLLVRRSSGPPA